MPAVAVTDHGNLFAAEISSTKPASAASSRSSAAKSTSPRAAATIAAKSPRATANGERGTESEPGQRGTNHLVLLCENAEGYHNLIKLVSAGFLEGFYYKPRIDYDLLAKHSNGLIALSACLRGAVTEPLVDEKFDQAREAAYRLRDIFGKGNFFLEIQDQGLEIEKRVNRDLVRLSKETGIPLVATNDCHYLNHSRRPRAGSAALHPDRQDHERHASHEICHRPVLFQDRRRNGPGLRRMPEALERTVAIAERCNVNIERMRNSLPEFKVPEGHTLDSYFEQSPAKVLPSACHSWKRWRKQGALRHPLAEYERRLSNEIQMIKQMRYAGYFLIVWDFIRYARAQEIPVGPGRGSAAGSLVSYALHITDVDPLQYDLLFERFLNPERVSMPDIDIDFCMRRRGEVIEYVTGKYGRDKCRADHHLRHHGGQGRDQRRRPRHGYALRRSGSPRQTGSHQLNITLEEALEQAPQLKAAIDGDERCKDLMEVAKRLEGLARHASTHAAGVVISPQPLTDLLPFTRPTATKSRRSTT